MRQPIGTILLAGSAMALALPAVAAEKDSSQTQAGVRAFDVVTHTRALQSMPVMNQEGEHLGQIYDVVVSGKNQRVLYALLTVRDQPSNGSGDQASSESQASDESQTSAESQTSDEQQAEKESETSTPSKAASGDGEQLYPIPFSALQLADKGSLTASAEQKQMSEASESGEQDGEEQQAASDQSETGEDGQAASGGDTTAEETESGEQQARSLQELTVDEVVGMPVENREGEEISDVEAIVGGGSREPLAMLGVGGFLGIGKKTVAHPLADFELSEDGSRLITSMSKSELDNALNTEYEESDTAKGDQKIASLMEGGQQQGQQAKQAGSADQGEQQSAGTKAEDQPSEQQQTSEATKTGQDAKKTGEAARTLQNQVLVLNVEKQQLMQAPSFQASQFPDMADDKWHESVIAFYKEIFKDMPAVHLPSEEEEQKQ
jgi:sporulation protein YlmC with PRC-barrel domain